MTTIVTRAGKGSALTWTEGDANFTNLNNDKIEQLLDDLTPQLGGDLDVNDFVITSNTANGIALTNNDPDGGISMSGSTIFAMGQSVQLVATNGNIDLMPVGPGTITLYSLSWPTTDGTAGQVLTTDGAGTLSFSSANATVLKDLVQNQTGTTVPKGSVVYISGANGDNPLISLARADQESTSSKTLGFTMSALNQGDNGYVITNGLLEGIDTHLATIGDPVWLSPSTAGGFVFGLLNKPVAPNHLVYLGVVVRVNQNNGAISVKVQNGYELSELHNVSSQTPNDNEVLKFVSSTGLWTPSTATGGMTDIVSDTTPQLGGNLDANGFKISQTSGNLWLEGSLNNNIELFGFGTGAIKLSPTLNGFVYIDNQKFPKGSTTSGQVLTTDGAGTLSWATPAAGGGGASGFETNFLLMGA